MAGRISAVKCRWLLLIAEFDAREGCARFGLPTTGRWLAHYCGVSLRTAIEHVRVARALAKYPALAEEMRLGRLSYSHVRAISRVAHDDEPKLVGDLIEIARHGTISQLEVSVRGLRTVESNERIANDGKSPDEYVTHAWTDQSQWRQSARLDPERGAVVQRAVELLARAEQLCPADALVRMAEIALAAMNDAKYPPRALRGDERAAIVIHVNVDDLRPEARAGISTSASVSAEPDPPPGRIQDGPGLSGPVLNRLMCAGRIRPVVHGRDGCVHDLGRSRRLVSDRLFRALLIRDERRCTHPGCGSTSSLEAHHVRHWLLGGRTDLANLVLLCPRHHHAHHDGEFEIQPLRRGQFRFIRADGVELPAYVDAAAHVAQIDRSDLDHGAAAVAADAATPDWDGQRLERGWAISILADRRRLAADRSGTSGGHTDRSAAGRDLAAGGAA